MKAAWLALAVIACIGWCTVAHAQVFKCVGADGSVAFQDHACARNARQSTIDLPSHAPPGYVPPPAATVAPIASAAATPLPPPVAPPSMPLPVMYECVGAVNHKEYLTRSPPPPYLAPLGVQGYPPQSLSQAYGAPGGAGMSAPGMTKPRIGGPRIATGMSEVQDFCLPATQAQVCGFVAKEYAANQHRLNRAMRHAQPPLEARARKLEAQLRNCR